AHRARELLRAFAHQQVVIRFVGDQLRDARRRAHAFDAGDAAGALFGPVHAARVELDDAVSVRQTAPADAGLIRIELDNADTGNRRIEHVGAIRHHPEGALDAGDAVLVLRAVAVRGGDDAGLYAARLDGRCLTEERL